MSNQKFDWDKIMQDSAVVMAECIANNISISTIPDLYRQFEVKYRNNHTAIPKQNTYRQELHKRLNLQPDQRMVKSALYQLAGAYDRLTLDILASKATVATTATSSSACWLFIRLKRTDDNNYTDKQKHLYWLSRKLKEKFGKSIIFVSFDTDTLVILCKDTNSQQKITAYFKTIKQHD